jgi:hypothetical protein
MTSRASRGWCTPTGDVAAVFKGISTAHVCNGVGEAMPRVRDLLYRFRPEGAPGAAAAAGVPADRAAELTAELEPLIAAAEAHTASERAAATDEAQLHAESRRSRRRSDRSSNDHERVAALRGTPAADSRRPAEQRHERGTGGHIAPRHWRSGSSG